MGFHRSLGPNVIGLDQGLTSPARVVVVFSFRWLRRRQVARRLRPLLGEPATKHRERRLEERKPLIRPVVVAPALKSGPAVSDAQLAMTSDITSRGLAASLSQPLHAEFAYVGLHFDCQPHLFLASVRSRDEAGGGFHRLGMEFIEIADPSTHRMDALRSLTHALSLTSERQSQPNRPGDESLESVRRSLYEALESMGLS
jgi:hypothetical protein